MAPRTLLDKLWEHHVVARPDAGPDLLHVDLHLIHEVTSPQAFAALRASGRGVRRPDLTLATMDHNVPTDAARQEADAESREQMEALERNCADFGVCLFGIGHPYQGIVHVMGPELGLTQPGMTIVCGDSHTSTHGALGAMAVGIGTTEVEHVLATQCLWLERPALMEVRVDGVPPMGVAAKDVALAILRHVGVDGARGHAVEYTGSTVRAMSVEQRMTVCNMTIEAGGRAGMVSPDEKTLRYLRSRRFSPRGDDLAAAEAAWLALATDPGAVYERSALLDAAAMTPLVTWGTSPSQSVALDEAIPDPDILPDAVRRDSARRALAYMDLRPGQRMSDVRVDRVFIGSCTNSRIEDLRAAAEVARGGRVAAGVRAMVVPGSTLVRTQAEAEGLDTVFRAAGFEWREAGCSACLGMNLDGLRPGERCASTSNRNFEGRQGPGGRTHLVSPAMAAATALQGRFTDPRTRW